MIQKTKKPHLTAQYYYRHSFRKEIRKELSEPNKENLANNSNNNNNKKPINTNRPVCCQFLFNFTLEAIDRQPDRRKKSSHLWWKGRLKLKLWSFMQKKTDGIFKEPTGTS